MPFDPRPMSFDRWASMTSSLLVTFGCVPTRADEEHWKVWAQAVKNLPSFGSVAVPSPSLYSDWRLWGFRLNEALLRLGL